MVAVHLLADVPPEEPSGDQIFVMHGVSWDAYESLLATLGDDQPGVRMTYCEGTLELMSPGGPHEWQKTMLARLVEAYAEEAELPLSGYGSMTFRKKAKERGAEPDECYVLGTVEEGQGPSLAIEVIYKSGSIDKLSVYAGLGVPEVWFWRKGALGIHVLGPDGYVAATRSAFLPGLDVGELAAFVRREGDQTSIVRAWRARLREGASEPTA
jgi:Uma2 family endonuclease